MGTLTEAQRKWLEVLGVDMTVAAVAPTLSAAPPRAVSAGGHEEWSAPEPEVKKKPYLDLNSPEMRDIIMKGVLEQAEKDKKEAQAKLARIDKALAGVKSYINGMPGDELQKAGYAVIMTEVRKRYPEVAGLAEWVKTTSVKVPDLKGKLPSPKALMSTVESAVKARGAELGWSLGTGKDLSTLASDRLLAAYMAELPAGVGVKIAGGVVQLTAEGAALSVPIPGGAVDAEVKKGGSSVSLKHDDYSIQVTNEGWKEFDPQLRAEWKKISDEASRVATLKASRDEAKLAYEQKKKGGAELAADLKADFDKREAEFNLAWTKLQESVKVTAQASEKKIAASVAYLKTDADGKALLKAGLETEVTALQAKLKAWYASPTVELAAEVSAAADKVSAKFELKAVKTGTVVTASFEKALDETKAAIEVMAREGKTKLAAELKKKADDLSAKIKVVHETKDLKLAAELEKTLKDVRGSIEVEYAKGKTTLKGGATGSTSGEVGGKVQIDIALRDGRTFVSDGDKLSFAANVSNKGYKFEVAFSMGEPVDTGSLHDLFADADRQIKELYKLAGDKGVRSIEDAKALNAKLQEVMAPVEAAAKKAKTLRSKSEISASLGFSIQGDWPSGGKASPPAAMFGVTIRF